MGQVDFRIFAIFAGDLHSNSISNSYYRRKYNLWTFWGRAFVNCRNFAWKCLCILSRTSFWQKACCVYGRKRYGEKMQKLSLKLQILFCAYDAVAILPWWCFMYGGRFDWYELDIFYDHSICHKAYKYFSCKLSFKRGGYSISWLGTYCLGGDNCRVSHASLSLNKI